MVHAYVSSDWIVLCTVTVQIGCSLHIEVIYLLAGIIVIRGSLPTSVISVPRISLGGHLSSWHLANKLLADLEGTPRLQLSYQRMFMIFFVRKISSEKKRKNKGEQIDKESWA